MFYLVNGVQVAGIPEAMHIPADCSPGRRLALHAEVRAGRAGRDHYESSHQGGHDRDGKGRQRQFSRLSGGPCSRCSCPCQV